MISGGVLLLSGCAAYHPVPITSETVHAGLRSTEMNEVRLQADEFRHPLLKPVQFDDRDGLSPEEAAILAVIANPTLRGVRDRRGIASAQLVQAGILPNPQLSYTLDAPSGGTTAGTNTAVGFGLDWEITSLISRQAHMDAAQAQLQSVDLDIAWREWQIAQAARLSVYRVLVLEQQHELTVEVARRLDDNQHLVEDALKQGLATELAQSAAETAYQQAYQEQLDMKLKIRLERLELKQLIGLPSDAKIILQPAALPEYLHVKSDQIIIEHLAEKRLDLAALKKGYASQEASVRAAILEQVPGINIGLADNRDNSNLYTMGFGVSINLPIFDRNQGRIAIERATRENLFDEYISRLFTARANVARLVAEIDATNRLIIAANDMLPPLQRLVDNYRQAIEEGQIDILNYYIVWNDLTNQQIKLLSLKQRLVELRIALELASGSYQVTENNNS